MRFVSALIIVVTESTLTMGLVPWTTSRIATIFSFRFRHPVQNETNVTVWKLIGNMPRKWKIPATVGEEYARSVPDYLYSS